MSVIVESYNGEDLATRDLRKRVVRSIADYEMLVEGDRLLVAVSGGKDSAALALLLRDIQARAPYKFDMRCVMLDQKQPGFDARNFIVWMAEQGVDVVLIEEDTYSIVKEKTGPGKSYCGLCSRLRRGILYSYARANGFNKLALGHHRDDINVTLLMNMFYSGAIESMPPKLRSDDGSVVVIRPLCGVAEDALTAFAAKLEIPVIPCNLCGSQNGLRRAKVKRWLKELAKSEVHLEDKLFAAQSNIKKSQLFDRELFSFTNF